MAGTVVQATSLDSVRIEVVGEGRALTIPLSLVLAADRVFRHLLAEGERGPLTVGTVDDCGENPWVAVVGGVLCEPAPTPWGAILSLAAKLEGR